MDPIDRLGAEAEIRNLVARLGHLADDGDLEEYIACFTQDASWGHVGADDTLTGHAAILAGARRRRSDGIQGPGSGTLHCNTTLWVRFDAADEAHAESYFLFVDSRADPVQIRLTGRYLDRFRRTSDGWKLHERRIQSDVNRT